MMKAGKILTKYFNLKEINIVVRILIASDILIVGGFGLLAPIFAIFITDTIKGGTIEVAGLAAGIYAVTKGVFQIPFAAIIDKIRGEKDDFWAMFVGSVLFSFVPLLYLIISTPLQLFIIQFFYGAISALTFPSWCAIFTRHIDRAYEGVEWGLYQTLTDLSSAAMAFLGGFIAYRFGFKLVFVLITILSLMGSLLILFIEKEMRTGLILKTKSAKG